MESLLNKIFQEYNIDKDNVVIMGHSLGANNAVYLAKLMPDYFSKAVICSSGYLEYPSIPIRWYVGTNEVDYYKKAAYNYEAYYDEEVVCWLSGVGHQTPIPAYNKDDGTFLGIANNNCSDMIEWMFEDVVLTPTISGIELNEKSLNLAVGEKSTLSVTAQPTTADLSGQKITWKSANETVATVDENGVVTALAAGTTKITARFLEYTAECIVTVAEPIRLNLSEKAITLPSQQVMQLIATVEGNPEGVSIKWSSSNNAIAKVDEYGTVTALRAGRATITASAEQQIEDKILAGTIKTCIVTVSGQLGDVDRDRSITAYDAYKALETSVDYLIGTEINDKQIILTSDVNKNGIPEAEDAYKILRYSVGLLDKF